MKALVAEIIGTLPKAGAEAYQLQFRTRADRALQAALNENDNEAIIAVARRWFHTQAGHRAAILTAARVLESGQPLAAEAWLERIASTPMTNLPDKGLKVPFLRGFCLPRVAKMVFILACLIKKHCFPLHFYG
jgi:hypothetical protein